MRTKYRAVTVLSISLLFLHNLLFLYLFNAVEFGAQKFYACFSPFHLHYVKFLNFSKHLIRFFERVFMIPQNRFALNIFLSPSLRKSI
jgi:hypothetical protein